MKLAEALIEKKDLTARISALTSRLVENAVHAEGETPEESVQELHEALKAALKRSEELTVRINNTNNLTPIAPGSGMSIMQAIARRDALKVTSSQYSTIVAYLKNRNARNRYDRTENAAKMVLTEGVSVAEFQLILDASGMEYRMLDTAIQAAGWGTELL